MRRFLPLTLIIAAFFLACVWTLSDYGLNEDTPGHFLRGQVYLNKFLTGQDVFNQPNLPSPVLFIPGQRVSLYKINTNESATAPIMSIVSFDEDPTVQQTFSLYQQEYGKQSFYKHNAWAMAYQSTQDGGHPPVSDILASVTNKLFYERLGMLGDIQAYYLYIVIVASLALVGVAFFTFRVFGLGASVFATLSLALFPWFFAESHFNIKDVPELTFFSGSLVAFYFWVTTNRKRWFGIFLLIFLIGVTTKLNILFLPVIISPWLVTLIKRESFKKWFHWQITIYAVCFVVIGSVFFIASWPYLWTQPFEKIADILNFYTSVGSVDISIEQPSKFLLPLGFDAQGLLFAFGEIPTITVVFVIIGLGFLIRGLLDKRAKELFPNQEHILLLFWLCIPLLRVIRPGAQVFGSIRQYSEFVPALAIIAGVGGWFVVEKISKLLRVRQTYTLIGVSLLYLAYLVGIFVQFHPNENLYFNRFVGGLSGVSQMGLLDWQTSYDNPYKQGISWLNAHAEKNANLAYLDGTMVGIPSIWLRQDIHFGSFFSGFSQKGEYVMSIVYPNPPKVFPYLYLDRFLRPVYTVNVDGVAILKIWKNSAAFVKLGMNNFQEITNRSPQKKGKDNVGPKWTINLGKVYQLTSLTLTMPTTACSKHDGLFAL
ncbi:MAG: glycosyltransferase family 39 protein, partial [Patescibacteria group bacterium]|nr:glycosyltransferase family 39 protein [Patescibacteria group bacterium]